MQEADVYGGVSGTVPAGDAGEVSFQLPDDFMDEVRASLDGAVRNVTETLPSLGDILAQALYVPGVRIDRTDYLRQVLNKQPTRVVEEAIERGPAAAGVPARTLYALSRRQQGKEARRTTVLSVVAGVAGAPVAAASIPADLTQFYAHLMRMIQMLTYLWGWGDLAALGEGGMDETTRRVYLLFLGVMALDEEACALLRRMAPYRSANLVRPIVAHDKAVEAIEARLVARMGQRVAGQVVGKSVPLAGAVISGTISYGGFSDMCNNLRERLAQIG